MARRPGQLQQPPERAHVGGSSNPQPPVDLQPAAVPLHPTGGTSLCSGFDSPRNIGKFREIHRRNLPKIGRHRSSLPSLMEVPVSSRRPLVHWWQSRRAPRASSSSEVMRPTLSTRATGRINLHMRRGEAVRRHLHVILPLAVSGADPMWSRIWSPGAAWRTDMLLVLLLQQ
jgi:hypothetical protein